MFISKKKYKEQVAELALRNAELESKYIQCMFLCESKDNRIEELTREIEMLRRKIDELEKELAETDKMFDGCLKKMVNKIKEEIEYRRTHNGDTDFFYFSC